MTRWFTRQVSVVFASLTVVGRIDAYAQTCRIPDSQTVSKPPANSGPPPLDYIYFGLERDRVDDPRFLTTRPSSALNSSTPGVNWSPKGTSTGLMQSAMT
jgi:hypothetical protein